MRARGFSLVEFMIAMTIGLFLIAGLVYLLVETSRSRAEIERSSRQIENGRYAIDRLSEDLRHAGFFSEYFSVPGPTESGFPGTSTVAAPCAKTIAALATGMPLAVQAYNSGGSTLHSDLSCISAADYQPDTDILVIRRASTSSVAKSSTLVANQAYIQTTPPAYKLEIGANKATEFTLTLPTTNTTATMDAPLHRYIVRIYFVSKCNVPASGATCNGVSDDGGTPIPTLKMLELGVDSSGAGPEFQKLAIAEGIEHLRFDFGVDTDSDGVANSFVRCDDTASPCTTAQLGNVVAAQVYLVARNTERSPGYADDKTYNLGVKGYTNATNDPYRRHAYSMFVRLNNIAMRRE